MLDQVEKNVGTPERPVIQAARRRHGLAAAVLAGIVVLGGIGLWYHGAKPDFVPAAVAKMAYPLPDKPSVAVLPFENFSGEERDGFIARGLTEGGHASHVVGGLLVGEGDPLGRRFREHDLPR